MPNATQIQYQKFSRWEGDLYIDRKDADGNSTGLIGPLEAAVCSIQNESEQVSYSSKRVNQRGNNKGTLSDPGTTTVGVNIPSTYKDIVAAHALGEVVSADQAAGSLIDEPVTAHVGKIVYIGAENITAGALVIQDVTDTTTYTVDVDYAIHDPERGLVEIIGGAIDQGEILHVDGDHLAVTADMIQMRTEAQVRWEIRLYTYDEVDQLPGELRVPLVTVAPSAPIDFMAEEHAMLEFTGEAEKLDTESAIAYFTPRKTLATA